MKVFYLMCLFTLNSCTEGYKEKSQIVKWEFEDEKWSNIITFKDSSFSWETYNDDIVNVSSGTFLKVKSKNRNSLITLVLIPHEEIRGNGKDDSVYLDAESIDILAEDDSSVIIRHSTEILTSNVDSRKYITKKRTVRKTIDNIK